MGLEKLEIAMNPEVFRTWISRFSTNLMGIRQNKPVDRDRKIQPEIA